MTAVPVLTDGRVTLDALREDDAEAIVEASTDPAIARVFLSTMFAFDPRGGSIVGTREAIAESQEEWVSDGRRRALAIRRAGNPELFGYIALVGFGEAHVALWLVPQARGRGLAQAALRLLIGYAFDELSVRLIDARIAPYNHTSRRLFERCWFTLFLKSRSGFDIYRLRAAYHRSKEGQTKEVGPRRERLFEAVLPKPEGPAFHEAWLCGHVTAAELRARLPKIWRRESQPKSPSGVSKYLSPEQWLELFRAAAFPRPDRPLTVYRGATLEWALTGLTWSTSQTVALSYAWMARMRGAPCILRATAPPEAVLANVDQLRPERRHPDKEIICDPALLTDVAWRPTGPRGARLISLTTMVTAGLSGAWRSHGADEEWQAGVPTT